MTELRQRMMDAMLVRGLSVRTQECYVEAVARMARHYHKSPALLTSRYAHFVFTLPHSLNALYGSYPRWVIDTLFACTAQTLTEFAANPKWMGATNGTPAFSLVLHT